MARRRKGGERKEKRNYVSRFRAWKSNVYFGSAFTQLRCASERPSERIEVNNIILVMDLVGNTRGKSPPD